MNTDKIWQWHTTFAGMSMQHNYREYYLIDDILTNNTDLSGIVEIGTGNGALTTFLGLWGLKLNIAVFSIDIKQRCNNLLLLCKLGVNVDQIDCFSDAFGVIFKICCLNKIYLICDGGNKPKEFNTFVPQLKSGSIVSVHDWNNECSMKDIKTTVDKYCIPYKPERWEEMYAQFATFKIK
jgi:hypothetical protein